MSLLSEEDRSGLIYFDSRKSKVFNSSRSFRYAISMQPGFAIQSDQLVPRGYNIDAFEMMTTMITTTMTTISIGFRRDGWTDERTDGRTQGIIEVLKRL